MGSIVRILTFFGLFITTLSQIEGTEKKYKLVVEGGEGGGTYAAGTTVTITADKPPKGERFGAWERINEDKYAKLEEIDDVYSSQTTLVMPEGDTGLYSYYVDIGLVELRVWRGHPDDFYYPGERIDIIAKTYDKRIFTHWHVKDGDPNLVDDLYKMETFVTMPDDGRLELRAMFRDDTTGMVELRVRRGHPDGYYNPGERVQIEPIIIDGKIFTQWNVTVGDPKLVDDLMKKETFVTMPQDGPLELRAIYEDDLTGLVQLRVRRGTPDGYYTPGERIKILAETIEGRLFTHWNITNNRDPKFVDDLKNKETFVTIPKNGFLELKAMYEDDLTGLVELSVRRGGPDGYYNPGQRIKIVAEAVEGKIFTNWEVIDGNPKLVEDLNKKVTFVTMPKEGRLELEAKYEKDLRGLVELNVRRGNPDGYYNPGERIQITADTIEGELFTHWEVIDGNPKLVDDLNKKVTFVTAPKRTGRLELQAKYEKDLRGLVELRVRRGNPDGYYTPGERIEIMADIIEGELFTHWEVIDGNPKLVDDLNKEVTFVTAPKRTGRLELQAKYTDDLTGLVELRVRRGSPGGYYNPGERIEIVADSIEGELFTHWDVIDGNPEFVDDLTKRETFVTIPEEGRLELRAMYEDDLTGLVQLLVKRGSPDGYYNPGERIKITAEIIEGRTFSHWDVIDGTPNLVDDLKNRETFVTLPEEGRLEVKAMY